MKTPHLESTVLGERLEEGMAQNSMQLKLMHQVWSMTETVYTSSVKQ